MTVSVSSAPKVPSRRRRMWTYAIGTVIAAAYAVAFLIWHHAMWGHEQGRGWTTFALALSALVSIPGRVAQEIRNPEAAEAEARRWAERRAARPYGTGLRIFIAGCVAMLAGSALMLAGVKPAGVLAIAGVLVVIPFAPRRAWRKRWPQDFPVLARIAGRYPPQRER